MNIYFTGMGMVGTELAKRGYNYLDCDILDKKQIAKSLRGANDEKDILVHTAALTNVDECERDPQKALFVNVRGTSNLLDLWWGKFLYISTDHVFSGRHFFKYREFHTPNPVNRYGITKLAGETIVLYGNNKVVRTSKLFNRDFVVGELEQLPKFFTAAMKRSFLHVEHFVNGLEWMFENWNKCPNILNVASNNVMSHYQFFNKAADQLGYDMNLVRRRNEKLKNATPRPMRGGLDPWNAEHLGVPIYSTRDGIDLL